MDRWVQQDTVEIFVVSRAKSNELPASESNGLIETAPNEMQKGLHYLCPSRCGPCLCSTVDVLCPVTLGKKSQSFVNCYRRTRHQPFLVLELVWFTSDMRWMFLLFLSLFLFKLVLVFSSGLLQICSERLALRLNAWQFDTRCRLYFVVANCSYRSFLRGCTRSTTPTQ